MHHLTIPRVVATNGFFVVHPHGSLFVHPHSRMRLDWLYSIPAKPQRRASLSLRMGVAYFSETFDAQPLFLGWREVLVFANLCCSERPPFFLSLIHI